MTIAGKYRNKSHVAAHFLDPGQSSELLSPRKTTAVQPENSECRWRSRKMSQVSEWKMDTQFNVMQIGTQCYTYTYDYICIHLINLCMCVYIYTYMCICIIDNCRICSDYIVLFNYSCVSIICTLVQVTSCDSIHNHILQNHYNHHNDSNNKNNHDDVLFFGSTKSLFGNG